MPGPRFVPPNDMAALEAAVTERTAGICIEWIQGEGGVNPMDHVFLRRARELADRFDALLCFDEIQCGVGRTGKYYGYQLVDPAVMPDIMTAAKPIACGLPLGIIVANERAAKSIRPGMHVGRLLEGMRWRQEWRSSFSTCWTDYCRRVSRVGEYFRFAIAPNLSKRFDDFIGGSTRLRACMVGAELRDSRQRRSRTGAMQDGLLLNCTHETVLRFLPPYIITEQHVDEAVEILARAMS